MDIKELNSAYSKICNESECKSCQYNRGNCALNFGYQHGVKEFANVVITEIHNGIGGNIEDFIKEYVSEQIKEHRMCSNGKPCTHPNCKRCGTTHFVSECDYEKE